MKKKKFQIFVKLKAYSNFFVFEGTKTIQTFLKSSDKTVIIM